MCLVSSIQGDCVGVVSPVVYAVLIHGLALKGPLGGLFLLLFQGYFEW